MEQQREGGLIVGLVGAGEAEPVCVLDPFGGGQENATGAFGFWNEDTVEADVIHDDAVRKAFNGEGDEVVVTIAFDLEPGGDALAGGDGDFQWRRGDAAFEEVGLGFVERFETDKELWLVGEGDFAERIYRMSLRV